MFEDCKYLNTIKFKNKFNVLLKRFNLKPKDIRVVLIIDIIIKIIKH